MKECWIKKEMSEVWIQGECSGDGNFHLGYQVKKRIFGNDGGCLKPEDFPKCACQSQDLSLVPASSEDFLRGCIPITGFTTVLLSVHANHRTYHNSPAST